MINLNNYIVEALKIKSGNNLNTYKYFPQTTEELKKICTKLIDEQSMEDIIDLNCIDTSKITSFESLFEGFSGIIKIDISNWNTSNVKNMISMFYNCEFLEEIIGIDKFDTKKLEYCYEMFDGCTSLQTLDLSKWKVNNLKYAQYMFNDCKSLTSIGDVSQWDLDSIKSEGVKYMFGFCSKLKCDIRNWWDYVQNDNIVYNSKYVKI
jgi:surface protein